jgi:hypothetical protein
VIYSVAPNASDFTLRADDLEFWEDKYAHIELGF